MHYCPVTIFEKVIFDPLYYTHKNKSGLMDFTKKREDFPIEITSKSSNGTMGGPALGHA